MDIYKQRQAAKKQLILYNLFIGCTLSFLFFVSVIRTGKQFYNNQDSIQESTIFESGDFAKIKQNESCKPKQ